MCLIRRAAGELDIDERRCVKFAYPFVLFGELSPMYRTRQSTGSDITSILAILLTCIIITFLNWRPTCERSSKAESESEPDSALFLNTRRIMSMLSSSGSMKNIRHENGAIEK
jgi:hypothetical protein